MPFIISAGTSITGFGSSVGVPYNYQIGSGDRGIQSVGLAVNVTPNRLFHLGYITPYAENVLIQKQLAITCYGGASNKYNTLANQDCSEADPLHVRITAIGCDSSAFLDETDWWVSSYSYAKDIQGWGLETWNLLSKPILLDQNLNPVTDITIRLIRGVAEGEASTDGGADTGVDFIGTTINENTVNLSFIGSLEVRAENPGIGRANNKEYGVVGSIGKGTGKFDGKDGSGSANIPYTPIYIS